MYQPTMRQVAVVGCGVIGRGWIKVFARAGCTTRVFDQSTSQRELASDWFKESLETDVAEGIIDTETAKITESAVSFRASLEDTIKKAEYVQESGPERLEIKQEIFATMNQIAKSETILASSTSTMDIEDIAGKLKGSYRCFTAHPFNPPFVLPAVEMMPTKKVDAALFEQAIEFLISIGQKPVRMNYFIPGYLANRIQAAVVREAIDLVEKGVANVEAVDTVISEALGLRWAIFGNFGTNNTNADGGVREYYTRYGKDYAALMNDLEPKPPSFNSDMIERIGLQVDAKEGSVPIREICRWRDRMVLKIQALKKEDPHPKMQS
jgi:3-hydroxyacyl-CoA dehydrogenase